MKFEQYAQDGRQFVNEVATELGGRQGTDHAERVMTAVLHTMRDILSPEESLHLISQLPMLVKAIYVNGWHFHPHHRIRTMEEFTECLLLQNPRTAPHDFGSDEMATSKTKAVFRVLRHYVSEGEIRDIINQFPQELAVLWEQEPQKT